MINRVDRPFVHPRDTGFFFHADLRDQPEIVGHSHEHLPVISELWKIFGIDFNIYKRGSMRLAFIPASKLVVATAYARGTAKGVAEIHLDSCHIKYAELKIPGSAKHSIALKILCLGHGQGDAYAVIGNHHNHSFLSIDRTLGGCLEEIGLKIWDIGLINLIYTPGETV